MLRIGKMAWVVVHVAGGLEMRLGTSESYPFRHATSRRSASSPYSQFDCFLAKEWSQCSVSCGGGQRSRVREVRFTVNVMFQGDAVREWLQVKQPSMGGGRPGCSCHELWPVQAPVLERALPQGLLQCPPRDGGMCLACVWSQKNLKTAPACF